MVGEELTVARKPFCSSRRLGGNIDAGCSIVDRRKRTT
jgi:hypothetical protein